MIVAKFGTSVAMIISIVIAISFQVYKNIMFLVRPGRTFPIISTIKTIDTPGNNNNHSNSCIHYPGPWGAEDFVQTKLDGWVIFSSLDVSLYPANPLDDEHCDPSRSGGLWTFNIAHPDPDLPQRIKNIQFPPAPKEDGEPSSSCVLTHGLFLSNKTDLLYVVTHRRSLSSIEVFQLDYSPSFSSSSVKESSNDNHDDDDDEKSTKQRSLQPSPPFKLSWVRSIRSSKFPRFGINSVVEGMNPYELYVTQSMIYDMPPTGVKYPKSLFDIFHMFANMPVPLLFGFKWTQVLKCDILDDDDTTTSCVDATDGTATFQMANGVAITSDRETVFVCDTTLYAIDVFHRQGANINDKNNKTGLLEHVHHIDLEYTCDNIYWNDDTNELWIGTVGDVMVAMSNTLMQRSAEDEIPVPGGLSIATKKENEEALSNGGNQNNNVWETHLIYSHDGTKLSGVSSAKKCGSHQIIFGSPSANGILVCQG